MLENQKVIIIGGTRGIGLAMAQAALARQAEVIIAGRSQERLNNALQILNHDHASGYSLDMIHDDLSAFFGKVGSFDHLIIAASELVFKPIEEITDEQARSSFESKFWGPFRLARAALSHLNHGGSITFVSGSAGRRPLPGLELLSAMNGALEGFSRSLAVSLANKIRVNTIAPGVTKTPVLDDFSEQQLAQLYQHNIIQRLGQPEEIAQAAVFLMENGFVTGQTLSVDGGYTLS